MESLYRVCVVIWCCGWPRFFLQSHYAGLGVRWGWVYQAVGSVQEVFVEYHDLSLPLLGLEVSLVLELEVSLGLEVSLSLRITMA